MITLLKNLERSSLIPKKVQTRRKPHQLSFCDKYEWTKSDIWELVTFITNFRKKFNFSTPALKWLAV